LPTTTFLILSPSHDNTASAPTLQAAGDIPRRIVRFDGSPLQPGDLKSGGQQQLASDGNNWLLMTLAPGVVQVPAAAGGLMQIPNGEQTFLDTNGNPLSGGQVFMYSPGTSTPSSTWVDPSRTVQNTNPIILDQAGRGIIWGAGQYRQVVLDQFGNIQWDRVTGQDPSFPTLSVTGDASVGGNLSVTGQTILNGPAVANSGLTVNPAPSSTYGLNVNGSLHIVPVPGQTFALGVSGDTSISGALDVAGTTNFHSALTANADATFNGTNIFNGYAVFYQGAEVRGLIPGTSMTFGVAGNSEFDGALTAVGITDLSDAQAKTDVRGLLLDCLSVVKLVEPKQYRMKDRLRYGLVAQDVQNVAPQAVSARSDGMLGISVGDLIAVLWGAVRELSSKIDAISSKPVA